MKKIGSACVLFAWTAGVLLAESASLADLRHPLLKKGQWALEFTGKGYAREYLFEDIHLGPMLYYPVDLALTPRFGFGLTDKVQLSFNLVYDLPAGSFWSSSKGWDYSRQSTKRAVFSGQLFFRPSPRLELSFSCLRGTGEERDEYAVGPTIDGINLQRYEATILTLQGAWLSGGVRRERLLRSDLDGLHHPLLGRKQWLIEPEVEIMRYGHSGTDRELDSSNHSQMDDNSQSVRIRFATCYGISDKLKLAADLYGYIPFGLESSRYSFADLWGYEEKTWLQMKRKYTSMYGGLLHATWRPSQQLEFFLGSSHQRCKSRLRYEYNMVVVDEPTFSETVDKALPTYLESRYKLGGTWLSRPKKQGIPFQADLSGLYHPLLEKNQTKLDWLIYWEDLRLYWGSKVGLIRINVSRGLFDSLQASGSIGLNFNEHFISDESYWSLGFELASRHGDKLELFLKTCINPIDEWINKYPRFPFENISLGESYIDLQELYFYETVSFSLGFRLKL